MILTDHFFTTDDGVELHYVQASVAAGRNEEQQQQDILLLLPGWSQSTRLFEYQMLAFASDYRVISLDPRGHGSSEKPEWGYRLCRMARDVDNLLDHLLVVDEDNKDRRRCRVHVLAHSASCAVIWAFLEVFGQDKLDSLILVDQHICYLKQPAWCDDEMECRNYGAVMSAQEAQEFLSELKGPKGEEVTRAFLRPMFSDRLMSDADFDSIVLADALKFPRALAAQMAWSVMSSDYRDFLPQIALPCLCIAGRDSHIPPECMTWIASAMQNASNEILPGKHFMFYEESEAFNTVVEDFLREISSRSNSNNYN